VKGRKILKLHIGCGDQLLDGFVNIDITKAAQKRIDVRRGLPYRDSSVDYIFSEHFIEHLLREEAIVFLEECYRTLKPGGVLRVATPDLDDLVRSYGEDDWNQSEWIHRFGYGWIPNRCVMLNVTLRAWEHRHLFNAEDLKMVGHLAGFLIAKRCEVGKSSFAELSGLENRKDSVVVEFSKENEDCRDELPPVSIVIPAYSERYFRECLLSAIKQTYLHKEIIVCNDNPSSAIGRIVEELKHLSSVKYIENPQNMGAVANYTRCYESASGHYIKFLNDDDLLDSRCVRRMVCFFEAFGDTVKLVSSKRTRINARGEILDDDISTLPLVKEDSFLDGKDLGDLVLRHLKNLLGEPTTIMFRKKDLAGLKPTLFSLNGKKISFNVDMVILLNLLSRGEALYLAEPLSYFRIHEDQEQQKPPVIYGCIEAWPDIVKNSRALGFLEDRNSYLQSITTFTKDFKPWEESPLLTEDQRKTIKQIIAEFRSEIDQLQKPAHSFLKKKKHPPNLAEELQLIQKREGWNAPLKYFHVRSPIVRNP
jgi:predicted SAM-dependent methyltransferase/glycosyltransferase involved in cell wall biosynthesis